MSPHTFPSDRAISFRERAEALGDLVRAEAADAERQGRLTDKIVAALQQERLLAVLFPESAGGLGGSRGDLFEITEVMARADGSTGWCVALSNVPTFAVFRGLSAEGREDVFGRGHVSCWAALIPNASSTAVSGGFRISGKWAYGSTSSFARWVLVTSVSKDAEGRNLYRAHLVPKEDVEIIEGTWDVLGLRATASIDYAITDKFVPAHRTYEFGSEGTAANGPISAMETVWLNQVGLRGLREWRRPARAIGIYGFCSQNQTHRRHRVSGGGQYHPAWRRRVRGTFAGGARALSRAYLPAG